MNSVPVLVIGKSGSGKSTSLRNFTREDVAVINVLGKQLPFKSDIKAVKCDNYDKIIAAIKSTKKKTIIIDDSNYLMTKEFMEKAKQTGYQKFTDIALSFYNLIEACKNLGGGKTVYFFMHEQSENDGTNVKPKTIGQMLDNQVCIEGIFTICLRTMYSNGKYIFRTKTNGQDCVKTPFGMFEDEEVENDLKAVNEVIREYYELDKEEKLEKEEEK